MMKYSLVILLSSLIMWSCSSSEESCEKKACEKEPTPTKIINPNGDSELALAMRSAFDESMKIKKQLKNGEEITISDDYLKNLKAFHTAVATDPDVKVDEFFAFSDLLYNKVEQLNNADSADKKEYFNGVVNSCIACHESFCPGPIVKINKLKLK